MPTWLSFIIVNIDSGYQPVRSRGGEVRQPALPEVDLVVKAQTSEGHLHDAPPCALLHADVTDLTLVFKGQNMIWKMVEQAFKISYNK